MKLAVSNIAWPPNLEEEVLAALQNKEIAGIEVAPTRWWPGWKEASPRPGVSFSQHYTELRFTIPALQAILFGRVDEKLFGDDAQREDLMKHLQMCADLARVIGAQSIVFGAPKNRELNGASPERAFDMAREFFISAGEYCARCGVCLCLEPNPPQYGCEFMTHSTDAGRLVRAVNSPGFGLHLDTACMYLAQENIGEAVEKNLDVLRHFHVSEPFLGSFDAPIIDHSSAAQVLPPLGIVPGLIEMREPPDGMQGLMTAIDFLTLVYGQRN